MATLTDKKFLSVRSAMDGVKLEEGMKVQIMESFVDETKRAIRRFVVKLPSGKLITLPEWTVKL